MHSPPRKLTAADQEAWKIPRKSILSMDLPRDALCFFANAFCFFLSFFLAPISNWKNPKGYTVPLDKRLAAAGKGLEDVTINDKFAQFSEALFMADRHAREEVRQRAQMQQRLAEKEKLQKEEHLRELAQQARAERADAAAATSSRRRRDHSRSSSGSGSSAYSRSRSRSQSRPRHRSRSRSGSDSGGEDDAVREREDARREKRREEERKLRQSRMGTERRMQVLAREQNRDISEKVALGLAKPTASAEGMYDSRLFNQTSGFESGINEDNPYDKPLFAAQDAISSIYQARGGVHGGGGDDDYDDDPAAGDAEMAKIQKATRFGEALGRGTFKGARDVEAREGPVQFEKETTGLRVSNGGGGGSSNLAADPFNVDKFLSEVEQSRSGAAAGGGGSSASKRGYGLQADGGSSSRQSKRARVEEDDD